jgi:hypothetical protein
MTTLLNAFTPFSSRGVHPFVSGVSMDFSPAQQTAMGSIDGSAATVGMSGTTNAGVIEWKQSAAATLTPPAGEVLTVLTVEMVARIAAPVTYTTDAVWGIELYDSRTGGTLGAIGKQAVVPIASGLQSCLAGGVDLWGLTPATLASVLSANALRIRWVSPGWTSGSTGSLVIDGARVTVQSGVAPTSKRQVIQTRRTGAYGRVPQASELAEGELALNLAEGRLYAGRGDRTIGLNAVPFYWSNAQYQAGYVVMGGSTPAHANRLWVANKTTGPGARIDADWNEYHAATAQNANLLNGLNANQIYNIIYPGGNAPRLWRGSQATLIAENNALAALGFDARWWIADGLAGRPDTLDRVVRGSRNDAELGAVGGSWTALTDFRGDHAHSGSTFGHALSVAEMPSHNHNPDGTFTQLGRLHIAGQSDIAANDARTNASGLNIVNSATIVPQGGDQQHFHGIGNDGSHQHGFALEISHIRWWYLVRTA